MALPSSKISSLKTCPSRRAGCAPSLSVIFTHASFNCIGVAKTGKGDKDIPDDGEGDFIYHRLKLPKDKRYSDTIIYMLVPFVKQEPKM